MDGCYHPGRVCKTELKGDFSSDLENITEVEAGMWEEKMNESRIEKEDSEEN